MKDIVVASLLGKERLNIEGFINYHSPFVKKFVFVYNESDEQSLNFVKQLDNCEIFKTDFRCHDQENLARNFLQTKINYKIETALLLDLDERLDLRTLRDITDQHLVADVTIGIVNNCDNYYLIDGYPRQIFSNVQLEYVYHTHSWAKSADKSVFYLDFPKVNHLIQKPFKKPGFENDHDVFSDVQKFLDKKLTKTFMDGNFLNVALIYEENHMKIINSRPKFHNFMVYVLACEKIKRKPNVPRIGFFDVTHPTQTEIAVDYLFHKLIGQELNYDLNQYQDNQFGILSTYAKKIAIKNGLKSDLLAHMWRS